MRWDNPYDDGHSISFPGERNAAQPLPLADPAVGSNPTNYDGTGFIKLSVVDAKGRVDRVTVRLKGTPAMASGPETR